MRRVIVRQHIRQYYEYTDIGIKVQRSPPTAPTDTSAATLGIRELFKCHRNLILFALLKINFLFMSKIKIFVHWRIPRLKVVEFTEFFLGKM